VNESDGFVFLEQGWLRGSPRGREERREGGREGGRGGASVDIWRGTYPYEPSHRRTRTRTRAGWRDGKRNKNKKRRTLTTTRLLVMCGRRVGVVEEGEQTSTGVANMM
jgi:hypothetical protein